MGVASPEDVKQSVVVVAVHSPLSLVHTDSRPCRHLTAGNRTGKVVCVPVSVPPTRAHSPSLCKQAVSDLAVHYVTLKRAAGDQLEASCRARERAGVAGVA